MASASSALTIEGLQTFLARSKRLSIDPALDLSRTLLVLGNESGDVDSIVASIVTAFASSELDRLPSDRVAFIPVLNLKREDLALRPETLHLFDMLGIAAAELVFVDEFATVFGSSSSAEALAGLQVVLVDHNQLIASQLHLAPFVTLVLDHHARQECPDDAAQLPNARRLVIETVGSACTLVAEYACQLLPSTSAAVFDSGIATLLLAAILLDTFNLDAKAKRATEKDHSYGRLLGAVLASSENPTDIEAAHKRLFLQLQHAKEQIDHLSSRDLLRKDYKEWRTLSFGIASVPCSLESWKTRDTALNTALVAYAQERHLEVNRSRLTLPTARH